MKKIYLPKNLKNSFLSTLPQNEVEQKLSEAFYGIITNDKSLFNPLDVLPSAANDKFPEYIAYLLTNPEYFYFIIKYILQIDSWPQQSLVIKEMFNHRFPMLIATRGFGKSFVLAVYMIMRMLIIPGSQCVITSAGFRQAKVVFEYMERIWKKSIILQNCFKGAKNGPTHGTDVWTFRLGDSITYAIPVGPDGSKVRGYRANCLVADEFATLPRQVFEEVMSGFLSVAPSPVEQIKHTAELDAYKKLKIPIPKSSKSADFIQNQLILSGTAYYKINHFYAYYNKWKDVINSKHDAKLRKSLFENEEDYKDINPDDYTIIRIPIELTVSGYMDMAQIARIKASTTKDVYKREYSACFSDDSEGFFKKSLIDSCTVLENDKENLFAPCLYGNQNKKYVIGVDPAYEGDNFAVVVLEINGRQRRVVHCWTTQSSDHKQRLRDGVTKENQYFHFCARKIRSLMKHFPPEYIAIDPLGGGRAVIEALMDPACLETGELLILETIDPTEKPKETDLMTGLHILKIINFTSEWIAESNYSMKKDMEDKLLLFPFSDDISYALAEYYDESLGDHKSLYDTLDDCIFEIEELKKELTTIVVTESVTGRERFDTPSIKTGIQKKGRLKKDRYSALLMANWVGRSLNIEENRIENPDIVMLTGFGSTLNSNKMFKGNSKVTSKLENLYKNYRM